MSGIVGSLASAGAIKQGGLIAVIDFGKSQATSAVQKLSIFLCVFNGVPYLFQKLSTDASNVTPYPLTARQVQDIGQADLGVIWDIANLASHPSSTYANYGISYVSDNTTDVFYTDGLGVFKAVPFATQTASDQLSSVLAKFTSVTGDTTTTTTDTTVVWWKKPIVWAGGLLLAIGGGIWYWSTKD